MRVRLRRARSCAGLVQVPGDKSVSHRALILSAIARGTSVIEGISPGADVRATAEALRRLGVTVVVEGARAEVVGVGVAGLQRPSAPLDCGNSGTTMRLLLGLLAGAELEATLDGDASLRRRPMRRILQPLREMGARVGGAAEGSGEELAPLVVQAGGRLTGRSHTLPIASAQVKSGLLLAGLRAEGETTVREPAPSRDHTERMLAALGAPIVREANGAVRLRGPVSALEAPGRLQVPGDPSSAAFLLAAAALVPDGSVELPGVSVNPTRSGFLRALERMGAPLTLEPAEAFGGEPRATCRLPGGGPLAAIHVRAEEIPALVDEVPILAVLATQARGESRIEGAAELRVKESDRLARMAAGLSAMGADVQELPDGLVVRGPTRLRGATLDSGGDHRIAMSLAIAGLIADGETTIEGAEWVDVSFPTFFAELARLTGGAVERD